MSDIVFKNVNKSFGEKHVVKNFSHTFKQGARYCIVGASGSGKSTLLSLLLSIYSPDSGEISGVPENISVQFQSDRLFPTFTAFSNVRAVCDKTVSDEKITDILKDLGLENDIKTAVNKLSGGMARRVSLARALAANSDLVILDEPFKGLDDSTRATAIETVNKYLGSRTLVFVTHELPDASALAAEIISLDETAPSRE